VVYDSRRVGENATIPPANPDNPNRIPATWLDLLDESYAGKISTNPFVLPRAIAGLGTVWGVGAAEDYARRLAEDQQLLASFGDTKMFFLDETRPQMYYLAQVNTVTEQWETQNLTTDYVVPEPIVIEQQGTGVMATAPHPAAAALLAGWLASPESIAIRKRVADSAELLPDSDDELARELRARNVEIVYDTPATTALRGELAASIQPYISPGYSFYDRDPQGSTTVFRPAADSIRQGLEEILRRLQNQSE
jgi:ABC-type Fe3+ transport system substrate-binding protein